MCGVFDCVPFRSFGFVVSLRKQSERPRGTKESDTKRIKRENSVAKEQNAVLLEFGFCLYFLRGGGK
jgi:hypothetical protein